MWLERGQNLSGRISEESNQFANQALPSINPVSYSLPQVTPVSQQAFNKDDMQKAIQDALAQQKTENQTLIKKITELESQMAKQTHIPTPQTVEPIEPVRQLRGYISQKEMDHDYPVKPFQRPRPHRSNVFARIDRVEEGINETRDAVNQLTNQFQKLDIRKCDTCGETGHSKSSCPKQIARSNFNQGYFKPLTPINFQNTPPDSDNDGDGYDEENNRCQPETYDELLPKLSPAMRKMCLSRKALEEKSKKDEWFSSLQYLNANINDLLISNSFLDSASEFCSLGWFTDVPISIRDKDGKIVTATGNFTRIYNGEPEPILCLTYIIPTFSKAPVVKDLLKEEQDQASANSSNLTGDKDLKKSVIQSNLEIIGYYNKLVLLYKSKTSSEDSVGEIESEARTALILDFLPSVFFALLSEITSSSEALILVSCILFSSIVKAELNLF
ncbi:hypothetical protein GLOIN_2v1778046 [Rhizophagus clarus]|uniref:CCHC-type domain-containing protein n=1 Tax=Rhizophagus clarus TaxID=94130 RepID=A0A8H3MFJ2_9GLOM|nr:hypothetical protein GLOIN_2v1778046 [Rhizophagus clarus]